MQLASPDYLHLGHKWKPPSHAAYDLGDCSRNVALKAAVCEIKPTIFVYFLIFKIIYTFFYARIYLLFFFFIILLCRACPSKESVQWGHNLVPW